MVLFLWMQILTFFTLISFHGLRNSNNFAWIYYRIQIHVFCGERINNFKITEVGLYQSINFCYRVLTTVVQILFKYETTLSKKFDKDFAWINFRGQGKI